MSAGKSLASELPNTLSASRASIGWKSKSMLIGPSAFSPFGESSTGVAENINL